MYVIDGQKVFVAQRETSPQLPEVKIVLPEELKKWLVDDWDFVTRQKQVNWESNVIVYYILGSINICVVVSIF